MENLGSYRRTHYCGALNEGLENQNVVAMGWVNRVRKLGQLIFVTLRDHTGLVQIAFDESTPAELFEKAESLRSEYVVAIAGRVALRREKDINPDMATGKIEIMAAELVILSASEVPPFQVGDENVSDSLRLKHRYLDLRREGLQRNLRIRHHAAAVVRNFLDEQGYAEVETPILTNSSPEGARDYLVPSRVNPGKFYALPQSPQILKQILMVGGFDKYYQIAKCLRDEDLRADRQPEFTQIDIEASFVDQDDVMQMTEGLVTKVFAETIGVELAAPFMRLSFNEAMERFGSDKPDLRFGMELVDISGLAAVARTDFGVFRGALDAGGSVRGINAKNCGGMSRKQIDSLIDYVKTYRAKGLAWIAISEGGEIKTMLSKFFDEAQMAEIIKAMGGENGDLLLFCADSNAIVFDALGNLRCEIARRENLIVSGVYKPLWIIDFPLLIWDEDDKRYYANHHPFTAPKDEDYHLLDSEPHKVRAKQHDLIINGYETAGGSIRIHRGDMQRKMFEVLGYSQERAYANFSHLMEALKFGAPPHGGIAFGFDRLIMHLCQTTDIRDVIAFPKQQNGTCAMTGAPNTVFDEQLEELRIKIEVKPEVKPES